MRGPGRRGIVGPVTRCAASQPPTSTRRRPSCRRAAPATRAAAPAAATAATRRPLERRRIGRTARQPQADEVPLRQLDRRPAGQAQAALARRAIAPLPSSWASWIAPVGSWFVVKSQLG